MRVLVCGGRDFTDYTFLAKVLDLIHTDPKAYELLGHGITCIIAGAARGADTLAVRWAKQHGVPYEEYPAQWKVYGKQAGPMRNLQMLAEGKPDVVVAMPGGTGTADMVRRARGRGGLMVLVFEKENK